MNYTIKLTHADFKNLPEFLKRCPLKGDEVPAFLSVMNALAAAKPEEKAACVPDNENAHSITP
jgi:hypothetical protein